MRRRILSVFLLLLFSLGLTVPAALAFSTPDQSAAEQKLPPCCRKDGKHRCGMAASAPNASGARLASAKCSECPRNGSQAPASFSQQLGVATAAAADQVPVLPGGSAAVGAEARLFASRLAWRLSSKRGPPSSLLRS